MGVWGTLVLATILMAVLRLHQTGKIRTIILATLPMSRMEVLDNSIFSCSIRNSGMNHNNFNFPVGSSDLQNLMGNGLESRSLMSGSSSMTSTPLHSSNANSSGDSYRRSVPSPPDVISLD